MRPPTANRAIATVVPEPIQRYRGSALDPARWRRLGKAYPVTAPSGSSAPRALEGDAFRDARSSDCAAIPSYRAADVVARLWVKRKSSPLRLPHISSGSPPRCWQPHAGPGRSYGGKNMTQVAPAYATRIQFVSACPRCGHERAQWYVHIALTVLFRRGLPVEGYCGPCQEYWQLSTDERTNLAAKLAAAHRALWMDVRH